MCAKLVDLAVNNKFGWGKLLQHRKINPPQKNDDAAIKAAPLKFF